MHLVFRALQESDWPQVKKIYEEGLATGIATFETEAPNWQTWDEKYLPVCRLVALSGEEVVAWAALSPFSKRAVYKGVAEVSIYVSSTHRSMGVGLRLLKRLITMAKFHDFWTLQAAIFAENKSSIHIHEQAGFRQVGVREKIAQREGLWFDNVLMELRL